MSLLDELKRRNVVRMAMLYAVGAWVTLQVADVLFGVLDLPVEAIRFVVAVLLLGFPIVLVLSWVYEITPDGLKRESEIENDESVARQAGRKMNVAVAGLLVIAIAMLAADRLVPEESLPDAIESSADELSIAVLPFANRSAKDDDVYFVDGIHDDILTQLVRIDALTVTSRTSVERYRNTTMSIPDIAAELGVGHVLEGGVQRAGNRVRINLQLIRAADDDHVWADTFERELTAANIFDVQAEIARAVTNALQATLQSDEQAALEVRPTESIEAYELYLLGRFHWNQRTQESINLAQDYFERATLEDPRYTLALSGLADSYVLLVDYGNLGGDEAYPLAEAAIQKAMSLDDAVSEVWASLGLLRMNQLRNDEAETALLRAIELDERNFSAWNWYGIVLANMARFADAINAFERAYLLEPLSRPVNSNLASYYSAQGRFGRARTHMNRMTELDQEQRIEYQVRIAETYLNEGRLANAVEAFRGVLANSPDNPRAMRGLALTRLLLGDELVAREWYTRTEANLPVDVSRLRLLEAQSDFEASILLVEDLFQRIGSRRNPAMIGLLFRASYLGGDLARAADYHRERLAFLNGQLEVEPTSTQQFDALLVAEFLIKHGVDYGFDANRGEEILDEALAGLTSLNEQGYVHPETLASLAIATAMKGDVARALEYLAESVERGGRDTVYVRNYAVFRELAETPEMRALRARINAAVAEESQRLATLALAPYAETAQRQPIPLGRDALQEYEGYYTDGNLVVSAWINEKGNLVTRGGQQGPIVDLFPYEKDRFFTTFDRSSSIDFGRDDTGEITHMLFKASGGVQRLKSIPPPPAAIELDLDILARYEGTYAWRRLSAAPESETEADYWVAEISIIDGVLWMDLDDQPALELTPYAETEFYMAGFVGHFVFDLSESPDKASRVVYYKDGMVYDFFRR